MWSAWPLVERSRMPSQSEPFGIVGLGFINFVFTEHGGSLPSSSSPGPAADHAAMSAVLEQMMRQSAQSYMAGVAACDVHGLSFDVNQGISSLATQHVDVLCNRMVVDLGCLRTVAGVDWLCREIERCKTQGRKVLVEMAHDYFSFGDGVRRLSKYRGCLAGGWNCRSCGSSWHQLCGISLSSSPL